ncbi:MAG TPA: 5-formyltetrahydrofolate cyclo-ligase, partial [Candidatus Methylomirabilis sp.]|nr:5-formyltetrahydrofolate cyclo-ligase [Candidatus Methylomirabilis sp.]
MQTKAELRRRLQAARQAVLPADRAAWSARIMEQLLALPEMQEAERVLFYASLAEEVDTWPLLRAWLERGRLPLLPGVERRGGPLWAAAVRDLGADLRPGAFGILEPDRSLRALAPHARRIGLAFECQVVECLPAERHDVP